MAVAVVVLEGVMDAVLVLLIVVQIAQQDVLDSVKPSATEVAPLDVIRVARQVAVATAQALKVI